MGNAHHDSLFPLPLDLMDPDYYNPLKQQYEYDDNGIESSQETYKTVIENSSSINLNKQYIELQKDELQLQQEVEQLQNESKLKQEHLNVIDDNENVIHNISNETKEKIKIKLPELKHKLCLYKSWFDIQWNNDINNKQIISAVINSNNQFEEFTFDKNKISQFDLDNKIGCGNFMMMQYKMKLMNLKIL